MEQDRSLTGLGAPFVGRERELRRLSRWAKAGGRLLTVIGPPGIGKTRLARRFLELEPGPAARFVDLSRARTPEEFAGAVALALEIPLESGDLIGAGAAIRAALGVRGRLVLVLDNFEQLVPSACQPVAAWLDHAPELSLLVTSREALRVRHEVLLELSPLGLPPPEADDRAAVAGSEAGRLFLERAPGYRLRTGEAREVAAIVRRLEGIPLAIELAASRLRVLGLGQLLERLQRRFDVLAGGARDAGERHATLRAAIDWSWTLLEPWERSALAQCSAFRGGFSADAAEAVVDLGDHPGAPPVMAVIASLVDKSLLRSDPAPSSPGAVQLSLYDTISEYARAAPETRPAVAAALERHLAYCRRHAIELWAAGDRTGVRPRLALDHDNFMAAAEHGNAAPPKLPTVEAVLELLAHMEPIVIDRVPLIGYLDLLDRAVDRGDLIRARPVLMARALAARARARHQCGLVAHARADAGQALELAGGEAPDDLLARVHWRLAVLERLARNDASAHHHLADGLACARRAGDKQLVGRLFLQQAFLAADVSALPDGVRLCEEALAAAEGSRDTATLAEARCASLFFHMRQGRPVDARREFVRFLRLNRRGGSLRVEGYARIYVGIACQEQGRPRQAMAHYERAIAIGRDLGTTRVEGSALNNLGSLHHEMGRMHEGAQSCERALLLLRQAGDPQQYAESLAHLAAIEAASGRLAQADERLAEARELADKLDNPGLRAALELFLGHVDLARHRPDRALARLAAARRDPDLYERSEELRLAHRLLHKAIAAGSWLVSSDGAWFRAPGVDQRVILSRRPALQQILAALLDAYLASPGAAVALEALIGVGWPGQQMRHDSACNRVHVAVTTLRNLGLRGLLAFQPGGYLLDPSQTVIPAERLDG